MTKIITLGGNTSVTGRTPLTLLISHFISQDAKVLILDFEGNLLTPLVLNDYYGFQAYLASSPQMKVNDHTHTLGLLKSLGEKFDKCGYWKLKDKILREITRINFIDYSTGRFAIPSRPLQVIDNLYYLDSRMDNVRQNQLRFIFNHDEKSILQHLKNRLADYLKILKERDGIEFDYIFIDAINRDPLPEKVANYLSDFSFPIVNGYSAFETGFKFYLNSLVDMKERTGHSPQLGGLIVSNLNRRAKRELFYYAKLIDIVGENTVIGSPIYRSSLFSLLDDDGTYSSDLSPYQAKKLDAHRKEIKAISEEIVSTVSRDSHMIDEVDERIKSIPLQHINGKEVSLGRTGTKVLTSITPSFGRKKKQELTQYIDVRNYHRIEEFSEVNSLTRGDQIKWVIKRFNSILDDSDKRLLWKEVVESIEKQARSTLLLSEITDLFQFDQPNGHQTITLRQIDKWITSSSITEKSVKIRVQIAMKQYLLTVKARLSLSSITQVLDIMLETIRVMNS